MYSPFLARFPYVKHMRTKLLLSRNYMAGGLVGLVSDLSADGTAFS